MAENEEELRSFNRTIVQLGEELGQARLSPPATSTSSNPEDEIYRHILLATKQMQDADKSLPHLFQDDGRDAARNSPISARKRPMRSS